MGWSGAMATAIFGDGHRMAHAITVVGRRIDAFGRLVTGLIRHVHRQYTTCAVVVSANAGPGCTSSDGVEKANYPNVCRGQRGDGYIWVTRLIVVVRHSTVGIGIS